LAASGRIETPAGGSAPISITGTPPHVTSTSASGAAMTIASVLQTALRIRVPVLSRAIAVPTSQAAHDREKSTG
jgi:hypothetical protein